MPPVPQCKNHKILSEHWRSVNYYANYRRCNNGGKAGWYRFKNEAGNKMPDYPPGQNYCNSHQPGKLKTISLCLQYLDVYLTK